MSTLPFGMPSLKPATVALMLSPLLINAACTTNDKCGALCDEGSEPSARSTLDAGSLGTGAATLGGASVDASSGAAVTGVSASSSIAPMFSNTTSLPVTEASAEASAEPSAEPSDAGAPSVSIPFTDAGDSGSAATETGSDSGVPEYQHQGVYQFGTEKIELATAITIDAQGNLWVAGYTFGALQGVNSGAQDVFVRKYPSNGSEPRTLQFGTPSGDYARAIALDANGSLWVAGETYGAFTGSNAGSKDLFVRKYPADSGAPVTWQFGTLGGESVSGLSLDAAGNVWAVGYTEGDLFGTSAGGTDAFVLKFPSDGAEPVRLQFGTAQDDTAAAVASSTDGSTWVTGTTQGALIGESAGGRDAFVRRFATDVTTTFTAQWGTTEDDQARALTIDRGGNIWAAGSTLGAMAKDNAGESDVFVRKVSSSGETLFTDQFGSLNTEFATALGVDSFGNVWVGGTTTGSLFETSEGNHDGFVRKYQSGSVAPVDTQLGTSGYDEVYGLATDSIGNVWVSGYTTGVLGAASSGLEDAYALRVGTR